MSVRGTAVGSGRMRLAAREALAIASECDAILLERTRYCMSRDQNKFVLLARCRTSVYRGKRSAKFR